MWKWLCWVLQWVCSLQQITSCSTRPVLYSQRGEKQLLQVRALGAHQQEWQFHEQQHLHPCHTHQQEPDRQQDVEVEWKCPVIKNDNFYIFFLLCEAIMPCPTCPVLLCQPHLLRASHHTRLGNKSLLPHNKLFRQNIFLHQSFPRFQDWMGCFGLFSPKAALSTGLGYFNLYWCPDSLLYSGLYSLSHRATPLIMFLLCVVSCKTAPSPKQQQLFLIRNHNLTRQWTNNESLQPPNQSDHSKAPLISKRC